ncbi:hypothetical protein SEA_CRISPICOUS1_83 [Mycobacterium phage Crispicous1]|nr:hypothetical protein SEA_CRISPICOUS1_83 [Mycobacterium phage Crispicous1]
MSTVTVTFRAKRSEYMSEDFEMKPGYKVPVIKHSHVSLGDGGARGRLFMSSLGNESVTRARLKKAGVGSVAFEDDPRWSINPVGDGFMADVSISFEV